MGGITLTKAGRVAGAPHGGDPGSGEPGASAPASGGGAPRARSGRLRTALVLTGLALALLLAALQQLGLTTALPAVAAELPGRSGHVPASWAVTAYLLTATASLPLHGKLGDLYGRKGMILLALVVFAAGTALSGWARTLDELVAFRAVQGLGAGGILTGAQTVAAGLGSLRRRARPLGLTAAVYATGSVAGPLVGAHLAALTSWRWTFHLTVPLSLLALILLATALKPGPAMTRGPGTGAPAATGGPRAAAPQPGTPGPGTAV
ncbi:MFS transporter, partial [Streptomyces sp. MUM 203J]|uniref:MFS transporter n=1 Tax=Streptomyces sp. MUM 203J TaxID=2791990 RepID=UPI001F03DE56